MKMKIPGVYTITNLVNGKIYVGKTRNLYERKSQHTRLLERNLHSNPHIQAAWNKYGKENIKWEILVECDKEYLESEEHYWATLLNTHDDQYGYNIMPTHPHIKFLPSKEMIEKGIETRRKIAKERGYYWSEEQRRTQSEKHKGKIISQHQRDLASKLLKGRKRSPESVEKQRISNTGVKRRKRTKAELKKMSEVMLGRKRSVESIRKGNIKICKSVIQLNVDGTFIKEWESIRDIERNINGVYDTGIIDCCKAKRKEYKGYKWMYKNKIDN